MKWIKRWIRRYFGFSQRETNGFIFLLIITVLAIAAPFLFNAYLNVTSTTYNPAPDQAALDSLVTILERQADSTRYAVSNSPEHRAGGPIRLHRFNPNTSTLAELMALGVSRYAAGNILKYRAKAGGFRYKEQLQRIYGLPEMLYQKLYPYIDLPAQTNKPYASKPPDYSRTHKKNEYPVTSRPPYRSSTYRLQAFDINTADTTELKKIRGIGSKLSARIVKFRDKLGGFARPEQMGEVYGLAPEIIDSLRKYTFVQADYVPQQLAVNTATLEQLRAHPYIGFTLARLIIAYRTQHGPFQSLDDLRKIKLVDEALFQKLKPYLQI
jgi:competence ComEA-like helix-hairpin-helix protein